MRPGRGGDQLCGVRAVSPLAHGPFRRYFAGQALSLVGDGLVPLTIAFAALEVGGPGALGLVLAANRVPIAVLVLLGGALGDRWDRRAVLVGADVARCATQAISGLLLLSGHAGVATLVGLQALAGIGTAVFTAASQGLVPALVPEALLQRANALLGLASNCAKIGSISAAGALVATVGPGVALLVDAGTFAASAISLMLLRLPGSARRVGRASVWRDVRDGARRVAGTPWLRTLLGYSALLQALVIGPHMVAGPLLAAQVYGGAGVWATIGMVQALGSLAGGAVALRWRPRRPLLAATSAGLLMAPYLAAFAVGAPVWLVAILAAAVGAQGALFLTLQTTTVQRHIPEGERSRAAAWTQLGNLVLLPGSLALAGPVAAVVGGRARCCWPGRVGWWSLPWRCAPTGRCGRSAPTHRPSLAEQRKRARPWCLRTRRHRRHGEQPERRRPVSIPGSRSGRAPARSAGHDAHRGRRGAAALCGRCRRCGPSLRARVPSRGGWRSARGRRRAGRAYEIGLRTWSRYVAIWPRGMRAYAPFSGC